MADANAIKDNPTAVDTSNVDDDLTVQIGDGLGMTFVDEGNQMNSRVTVDSMRAIIGGFVANDEVTEKVMEIARKEADPDGTMIFKKLVQIMARVSQGRNE